MGDGRHKIVKKLGRFKIEETFDNTNPDDMQRKEDIRNYAKKRRSSVF